MDKQIENVEDEEAKRKLKLFQERTKLRYESTKKVKERKYQL